MRGENEHERVRGRHSGAAELIDCFLLPLLILATYLTDAVATIQNFNPWFFLRGNTSRRNCKQANPGSEKENSSEPPEMGEM